VTRQKRYIPTLDGWRGLSVIRVILYHGRIGFFKSDSLLMRLSSHGDRSRRLLRHQRLSYLWTSAERVCTGLQHQFAPLLRAAMSSHSACLLCCRGRDHRVVGLGVIHIKYSNLPSCLLFYRNYRLLGPDEAGGFYTAYFWSLAIEEHFYLIWPVLPIAVKPKRAGRVAFLLAMAVAAWRTFEDHLKLLPGILTPSNLLARTDAKVDAPLWGCIGYPLRQYS
jgi:peptidoglycan/LPS O-acetylase OafA/YrhL